MSKPPRQLQLEKMSRRFHAICCFDIANMDPVRTKGELIRRLNDHVKWFRSWSEEAAQNMEREIHQIEYPSPAPTKKPEGK